MRFFNVPVNNQLSFSEPQWSYWNAYPSFKLHVMNKIVSELCWSTVEQLDQGALTLESLSPEYLVDL